MVESPDRPRQAKSTLFVGDRVLVRSGAGLLDVEYALFSPVEVLVTASKGVGVREEGYLTTAGFARERLADAGITSELVADAFESLGPMRIRMLARVAEIANVAHELGPYEVFEGGYHTGSGYLGVWLDHDPLIRACMGSGLAEASRLMQSLHLFLAVSEVPEDTPVRLHTANVMVDRKTGERSWRRVDLEGAYRLAPVLHAAPISKRSPSQDPDGAGLREQLRQSLRDRGAMSTSPERLKVLAGALEPPKAAVADKSSVAPAMIITDRLEDLATAPLWSELRKHSELLRGDNHLHAVAKFLSAMADRKSSLPELAVLASRAWLAGGEQGHARYFARRVAEDATATNAARLAATEILDSTETTNQSSFPPPVVPTSPPPAVAVSVTSKMVAVRAAPAGASLPPVGPTERPVFVAVPKAAAVPTFEVSAATPKRRAEIFESLVLPENTDDSMLGWGATPTTALQARIHCTRLARDLARDYRLWYGTTLKTDPTAIDAMQRHLRRRFTEKQSNPNTLETELRRHGAMFAEILARVLGGEWIDVSDPEAGRWAMRVGKTTVWPIGRVYRFYQQGHRESDLVASFLDLQSATR